MNTDISERVSAVQLKIKTAAESIGKNEQDILLIGASKTQSVEKIKAAFDAGIRTFGENYVQEFLTKWKTIQSWDKKPNFHFIGHLQSNKTKYIIDKVKAIQTVDSQKLIHVILKESKKHNVTVQLLVEINIGEESTKSGIKPNELATLLKDLPTGPHLKIQGLMAIPPYDEDPEKSRHYFKKMKMLADENGLKVLSMGMSHDFHIAIAEGATQIRVGTAIFGPRPNL